MPIGRRTALFALPLALAGLAAAKAASPSSWDGVWTGHWGGTDETSITIANNKVVSYSFKGTVQPVETTAANDKEITFGTKLFSITIVKFSNTTARAKFSSNTMGQTKADLTRR